MLASFFTHSLTHHTPLLFLLTTSSLSELAECHMTIVTRPNVVKQLSHMLLCPSIHIRWVHTIVSSLLTLSYTPATHPYIADQIENLLKASDTIREDNPSPDDLVHLRYYCSCHQLTNYLIFSAGTILPLS